MALTEVICTLPKGNKHTLKGAQTKMKNQTMGVEIEMTGITREKAAEVVSKVLNGRSERTFDSYDTYKVITPNNKVWQIMSDASIHTMKNQKENLSQPTEATVLNWLHQF